MSVCVWKKIVIQGLSGIGLVGFNISRSFISSDYFDKKSLKDFSQFFPNIAIIDNGRIKTQNLRLEELSPKEGKIKVLVLNGPQPQTDELATMFMQQFKESLEIYGNKKQGNIDIYFSFGAMMKSLEIDHTKIFKNEKEIEKYANNFLNKIEEQQRQLYIATAGNTSFDDFKNDCKTSIDPEQLIKEREGIITGLNGVLPAYIGQVLKIPVVTIMIETSIPEWASANSPLTQYIGILSSLTGLEFIKKILQINYDLERDLLVTAEAIKPLALSQLIRILSKEQLPSKVSHDRMYV